MICVLRFGTFYLGFGQKDCSFSGPMIKCGSRWKTGVESVKDMGHFFSGSIRSKVDSKSRFVLPQQMRYGFVEDCKLQFFMGLGLGGSLAIYRKSDIDKMVCKFYKKQHIAKYRKFFTLFFSTLHCSTCDKLGRVLLPLELKKATKIEQEIMIVGVMNRIEVWPLKKYEADLEHFLSGEDSSLAEITEEAFALLDEGVSIDNDGDLKNALLTET